MSYNLQVKRTYFIRGILVVFFYSVVICMQ